MSTNLFALKNTLSSLCERYGGLMSQQDLEHLFSGASIPADRLSSIQLNGRGKFFTSDVGRAFADVLCPLEGVSFEDSVKKLLRGDLHPFDRRAVKLLRGVSPNAALIWGKVADLTRGREFNVGSMPERVGFPPSMFGQLAFELYCGSLAETLDEETAHLLPSPLSTSLIVPS